MLPFLKPNRLAATVISSRTSEGKQGDLASEASHAPELKEHTDKLISAVHAKDSDAASHALKAIHAHLSKDASHATEQK